MSRAADIRRAQAELEAEWAHDRQQRPNLPPSDMKATDPNYCPVNRLHRFSMKGSDGIVRCWFCCTRREVQR